MEDFELLRNVTVGQYIPTHSVVHRLDPRTKILSAITVVRVRCRSSASVPVCTTRPERMMLIRSESASASARLWELSRMVAPSSLSSRTASWNSASISGSSPDVGSSSR